MLTLNLSLTLRKETKERNLEKGTHKKENLPDSNSQTNSSAYDNPTNCANLISLRFIAQHVIDKKLVQSYAASFLLVQFRLNRF